MLKFDGQVHADCGWLKKGDLFVVVSRPEWVDDNSRLITFATLASSSGSRIEFTFWKSELDAYFERVGVRS